MVTRTAELVKANRRLEQESAARQATEQRLATQYAIVSILSESATLADAIPQVLRAISENLGWDVGTYWHVDPDSHRLRCMELWHVAEAEFPEFARATRESSFAPGIGLPGRVWVQREPVWIADVAIDSNFPRTNSPSPAAFTGPLPFRCFGRVRFWA